ncbi:hypothetical protein [Infirmifilum sp. SLHALR2]
MTWPARRNLSRALAICLVFLVPNALLRGLSYLWCHGALARPVSSSHLATLSQTSLSTSTVTAERVRGS